MNIDQTVQLIEAITQLIGILIWPALIALALIRFSAEIKNLLSDSSEFILKGGGVEATLRRPQQVKAEATTALVAAETSKFETYKNQEAAAKNAKEVARVVEKGVTPKTIRNASQASVLWVDDRPDNNIFERQSLEALGVSFVLATSTEEALENLAKQNFDAIISDMGRPPDPRAGYTLLDRIRANGDRTPFIIYAGSNAPEHKDEARRHGAVSCTNRASELFSYVLKVISNHPQH